MITNDMPRNNPLTTLARDRSHVDATTQLAVPDVTAFAALVHNAGATLSPAAARLLTEAAAMAVR